MPEGDGVPKIDANFQHDNRGKRGIAIAVNKPAGADLVRRLAAGADVFLCNLLPRRQVKYGLDSESLLAVNPRLVHATLTGYGVTGPDVERAGYDITAYFGRGGIDPHDDRAGRALPPDCAPPRATTPPSLALLSSVLAALRLVEHTGVGQVVDVSLLATAAWTMATDLAPTLVDGQDPPAQGRRARPHALHGAFKTADDRWVLLFMPEPRWWSLFCEAVGRPQWVTDARFATFQARKQYMTELTAEMDELFAERTLSQWAQLLDAHGFIWGPAATVAEFASDPQAEQIGLFPTLETPAGPIRTVRAPLSIAGADVRPTGPCSRARPAHREVLTELGLSADELSALAADEVIGRP